MSPSRSSKSIRGIFLLPFLGVLTLLIATTSVILATGHNTTRLASDTIVTAKKQRAAIEQLIQMPVPPVSERSYRCLTQAEGATICLISSQGQDRLPLVNWSNLEASSHSCKIPSKPEEDPVRLARPPIVASTTCEEIETLSAPPVIFGDNLKLDSLTNVAVPVTTISKGYMVVNNLGVQKSLALIAAGDLEIDTIAPVPLGESICLISLSGSVTVLNISSGTNLCAVGYTGEHLPSGANTPDCRCRGVLKDLQNLIVSLNQN